jgi:hypothetical protein
VAILSGLLLLRPSTKAPTQSHDTSNLVRATLMATLPEDAPLWPVQRQGMPRPIRSGRPRPSGGDAKDRYVPIEPHISSLHWFSGGTVERPAGRRADFVDLLGPSRRGIGIRCQPLRRRRGACYRLDGARPRRFSSCRKLHLLLGWRGCCSRRLRRQDHLP